MTIGRIIDLSSNNHPNNIPINWPQVKSAGVTTAIIKATEGTSYTNPWYAKDMAGAQAVGIDVLAYHFASFTNAQAEAARFISVAGTYARILDIETSTNVAWVREFLAALNLTPATECTYGSSSSLGPIRAQIPGLTWPAAYGQNYPGWGVMWQFTSSAEIAGISGKVDESRWYGTQTQYDELFNLYDPPPPIKKKDETMFITAQNGEQWLCSGSTAMHLDPPSFDALVAAGVPSASVSASFFAFYTKVG